MKPAPEALSRGPPKPYSIRGERFYNVTQAAQIIGLSVATLHTWVNHGATPFGFEFNVRREPMIHDPRGFSRKTKTHMQSRVLIPAAEVEALRDILRDEPRRPGPISREDMEALKAAARRYRSPCPQNL